MEGGPGHGIVETHITTRNIGSQAQSKVVTEGLARQMEQRNLRDTALAEMSRQQEARSSNAAESSVAEVRPTDTNMLETILRLKLDHSNDLRKVEQAHHDNIERVRREGIEERDRLMAIIEQQSRELSHLYQSAGRPYAKAEAGYGTMIAEPGPNE